jgi:tetratricopeptide (TPR) repeat protein
MEYTAMGDAINVAARMEQTAEPGMVQIAEETYKHVAPLFEVRGLDGITVKGKAEPVNAYRVLRRKAQPGRLRGITGLETRLIGREWELGQLTAAVDRLPGGVGKSFCLVGEAGLGKSRLTNEAWRHWQSVSGAAGLDQGQASNSWYEAASFSYETLQPYALFQRLLRRMAGIEASEAESSVQQKIEQLIAQQPEDERRRLSTVFTSLLGLSPELEGEAFKEALFDSFPDFLRHRFATIPGVLVLDDIHWSDLASMELLLHLLPLTNELPLLLICVIRLDQDSPGWRIKLAMEEMGDQGGSVIHLHPLSEGDSNALIDELLEISDLPDSMRAQILEKSSGNPFFVEEVVRTLLDRGFILQEEGGDRWIAAGEDTIVIPDNIQALLTARIDRLAEEVRHTLQIAAVIGRSFYQRVLENVARADGAPAYSDSRAIEEHLSTLQGQQMILEAARVPERHFMFRHALTQEAAYKAILRRRRQAYHLRAGIALERFYAGDLDEHAAALAHHFWSAGDEVAAFRYLVMAGSRSFRLYALQEATVHYDRALEIARRTKDVDQELRVELCTQRGRTLELQGLHDQALKHYQEMQALGEESEDIKMTLASLTAQATLYNTPSAVMDAVKGEETAGAAQQLAREIGDWEAAAKLLWTMTLGATWMTDDPYKAIEYGEESLLLAREHGLERQLAYSIIDLAPAYMSVGRLDEARSLLLEAQTRFKALDDRPLLAQAYRLLGNLYYMQGQFAKAESELKGGLKIEESIKNRWGLAACKHLLAVIDFEQGDIGRTVELLEWSLQESLALGLGPMSLMVTTNLAPAYGLVGDWQAGLEILQQAHDHPTMEEIHPTWSWSIHTLLLLHQGDVTAAQKANEISQVDFDPIRPLTAGVAFAAITIRLANIGVALAKEDYLAALTNVDELLDYLEFVQMPVYRPETLYVKGRILREEGRRLEARQIWQQAQMESEAMGERRMRWQILAGLAEVADDEIEAAELRSAARDIVAYIAENAGRPEHRASFLNRPEVQRLLPTGEVTSKA